MSRGATDAILAGRRLGPGSGGEIPAGNGVAGMATDQDFQRVSRSARSKHLTIVVIDPPVTEDERLTDALAAFGLLCDRAIEYLDLFTWSDGESSSANGSTPA
jgi:hypothetical protein